MEKWIAKPTGDMTLSVVTESGEQILKVDMLSAGTMKAETNGDILVRTINNLELIAMVPSLITGDSQHFSLSYPDAGINPLPWSVSFDQSKLRVVITDANKKKIAEKIFPKKTTMDRILEIVHLLEEGINKIPTLLK